MNRHFAEVDGKPNAVTPRTRQPRTRHRPAGQGRQPSAGGRRHQGLRDHALRPVHRRLRGHCAACPRRQADRRRLCGRDDFAHQPGHDRHGALGAAADARSGCDHRRRRDGVPGRVPGRQRGTHLRVGRRQAGHVHIHLRPSDHPGRGVRRLPAHDPRIAAVRRLFRRDLPRTGHPVRAGALAHRQPRLDRGQERPRPRADRGVPQPRPPDGRHRPAAAGQDPLPQPPRPRCELARPDAVGPGPRVQGQRLRRRRAQEAARRARVCCATRTAATSASSTPTSSSPSSRSGCRSGSRSSTTSRPSHSRSTSCPS